MVAKRTLGEKIFDMANILFMILFGLLFIYPFWYVFILSFHDSTLISYFNVKLLPLTFTWMNYRIIFLNNMLINGFFISIARTVAGSVSSVFLSAMFAYGISKKHLVFRKVWINIMIITMFFSGGLVPTYLLYRALGILNSFWLYIIGFYAAWNIIIMKSFFVNLPQSLEESAKIDGANDISIFYKIVFPTSLPLFATMLLFAAVAHWNDWITAQIFVSNQKLWPIQTIMMRLLTQYQAVNALSREMRAMENTRAPTVETVKMATIIVATLPILVTYPFLQRYFVKGIMIGSIKE